MSLKTESVITGAAHDCTRCRKQIAKGAKAVRRSRRAMTYHERCHADARGNVSWYTHPECCTVTA